MPDRGKYPDELRERAIRLVLDHQHEYGSQWEAIGSVAEKLGPKAETVRLWVRRAETDTGLATDITDWIDRWNDDPKPFVWTKTADDILTSIGRYTSEALHAAGPTDNPPN